MIQMTLDYDFNQEKQVAYATLTEACGFKQIQHFFSGISYIHPSRRKHFRTVTVFDSVSSCEFGFDIDNTISATFQVFS